MDVICRPRPVERFAAMLLNRQIPALARCATISSVTSCAARRTLQTDESPPHAYLRPLLDAKAAGEYDKAEELEGVMALVLDREKTKNALSVRMVHVRSASDN